MDHCAAGLGTATSVDVTLIWNRVDPVMVLYGRFVLKLPRHLSAMEMEWPYVR